MKKNNQNIVKKENKPNIKLIKEELVKLKKEYEMELDKYKNASKDIIETEEKYNNISKKINKINCKQMIFTNKIDNDYITELNNYKLAQNIKTTLLSLFGFPFPNQEPFYFNSNGDLIAQLTISKEYLFNLALNKKSEYDIIKASYDNLDKNIKILKLIYDYMKLNFDIVNLMIKRENIFEENKKFTKIKDISLINVKILEKKIKEKYTSMKKKLGSSNKNINDNNKNTMNNMDNKINDFDELLNNSHLLSIKDFDEISGKSFMMSMANDNSIFEIFNEEEINKYEIDEKKLNYNNFNDNGQTFNQNSNMINITNNIVKNNNEEIKLNKVIKSHYTNSNIFTEEDEEKDINNIIHEKSKIFIKKYRNPQFKGNQEKDILKIEKSVGDSGCCASCT